MIYELVWCCSKRRWLTGEKCKRDLQKKWTRRRGGSDQRVHHPRLIAKHVHLHRTIDQPMQNWCLMKQTCDGGGHVRFRNLSPSRRFTKNTFFIDTRLSRGDKRKFLGRVGGFPSFRGDGYQPARPAAATFPTTLK